MDSRELDRLSSEPIETRPPHGRQGLLWYWASRLGLSCASTAAVLLILEFSVTTIWGTIYYPLPGVEEAAEYLYFTLPERFNPLFQLDESEADKEAVFRTDRRLHEGDWFFAREQSFAAERGENSVRIAFMGGSSVQGWPYREQGVVFAEQVGQLLAERHPELSFDIINAGVGTYSSFQLVDVADQLEQFNPDVVVIYAGHNDQGYYFFHRSFLDDLTPASSLESWLNRFNFFQGARLLRDRILESAKPVHLGNSEGVAFIPQDENIIDVGTERYINFVKIQQQYLPQIFHRNLQEVVQRLKDQDTEVLLAAPASNLRDFPPVFSMHFETISSRREARFKELLTQADELMRQRFIDARRMPSIEGNGEQMRAADAWGPIPPAEAPELGSPAAREACVEPLSLLREAEAISQSYAMLHFLKGTCLIHSSAEQAAQAFVRARDLSPAMAPFQRASTELSTVVSRVASEEQVVMIDSDAVIAEASELGIPEGRFFTDNIHFSAAGHRELAQAISEQIAQLEIITNGPTDRKPDPPAEQTWAKLKQRSREFTWGLGLVIPGAGMPVVGDEEQEQAPEAPSGE
ncbi:MAG: hypothetical protein CMP23_11230 [Rickettsiales bacterium]|nr:hypothetical protein [Rickettsiales bacterium]